MRLAFLFWAKVCGIVSALVIADITDDHGSRRYSVCAMLEASRDL